MSEPKNTAHHIEPVTKGLYHWTVLDDRIGTRSDAYAIKTHEGLVLIDPLPLHDPLLDEIATVAAVCFTIQSHQRCAWRFRHGFGVPVWAPRGAEGLEQLPDQSYEDGALLPGGLRAHHCPGPCEASFAFFGVDGPARGALFTGDLVVDGPGGRLAFVPDEYQDDPRATRASVRSLLQYPATALCPGHGRPRPTGALALLRQLLDEDEARPGAQP